jgi:hypothetical protein
MRWTRRCRARMGSQGGSIRSVSGQEARKTSGVVADGEVVWSWRSDAGAKVAKMLRCLAGDGGNQAWSPRRARISRKTIAQGRPDDPPVPVVLPRAFLLHADHGCGRHPAFPAPSLLRGMRMQHQLGRVAPRARRCVDVIPGREANPESRDSGSGPSDHPGMTA